MYVTSSVEHLRVVDTSKDVSGVGMENFLQLEHAPLGNVQIMYHYVKLLLHCVFKR